MIGRITATDIAQLLEFGREQNGVEFKTAGNREDKQLFARVVRAMLGMANRRDGGIVFLGIDDNDGIPSIGGLSEEQISSWRHDDLADLLGSYTEPSINFSLEVIEYEGKKLLAVKVEEFQETPIICTKDYPSVLRKGAVYVRAKKKPETSELPSHEDMRALLDLATEKRLRAFLRTANAAGIQFAKETSGPQDEDYYSKELNKAND